LQLEHGAVTRGKARLRVLYQNCSGLPFRLQSEDNYAKISAILEKRHYKEFCI